MHAVMGSGRLIAGRYRLQGPIGRGAMGIVWRGRDELLHRDVAVKEVQITAHASPADSEAIYQRTLREARTAARLSHPSVVTVFDVVEENGSPWIVMELVNARSLDRVITEDGPLPPLQAAELGASLVGALATAHAAGVLHRDVKPSNVLVTSEGKAVLTDFGIATFTEDPSQTQVGMVVGTPGFTAPERVRGDGATSASDLWSLGATLYAAVEGRGPFDRVGGSAAIIAGVATEAAPRSPSAGPLAPVIDALLSRDPGTRPDATTAARLLTEAATAARTGSRPLGDGWLAAEASTAERDPVSDISTVDPVRGSAHAAEAGSDEQRAAFLDPPAFSELSMPEWTGPADALEPSLGPQSLDETPLVAASQFADVGLGAGIGLRAAGAGLGAADALAADGVASAGAAASAALGNAGAPANAGAGAPANAGLAGIGLATGPTDAAGAPVPAMGAAAGGGLAGAGLAGGVTEASGAAGTAGLAGPLLSYGGDGSPVLWEPLKQTQGGPGASGNSPAGPGGAPGSGGSGSGNDGGRWFGRRGGPASPSSGRWRLMVAGAGIAAIVVAAVIGWDIYSHTQAPQALGNPTAPSITAPGAGSAKPGSSGSAGGSNHKPGTTPTGGGSAPTTGSHSQSPGKGKPSSSPSGKPSSSPSGKPSGSPSPSGSPTPSHTPTPSPSPSPSSTAPVLPTGYVWHHFSAAVMASTAGFKIGMPSIWVQSVSVPVAHLSQPVRGFHLNLNLALWTYVKPLAQAQYLQAKDAKTYNGYKELSLSAVGFSTLGGFKAAPAAELKFTWTKPLVGSYTELVILVTLTTKSGVQPYTFTLWAPSASFSSAHSVFDTALATFRPLPAT